MVNIGPNKRLRAIARVFIIRVLQGAVSAISNYYSLENGRAFGYVGARNGQILTCTAYNTATVCPTDDYYTDDLYLLRSLNWDMEDIFHGLIASRTWKDVRNLQIKRFDGNLYYYTEEDLLINNVAKEVGGRVKIIVDFSSKILVEGGNNSRDNPLRVSCLGC